MSPWRRPTHYILNDAGEPEPCENIMVWARWYESTFAGGEHAFSRVVQQDEVEAPEGAYMVSTIFMGLDHNHTLEGPPVLWETMVFAPPVVSEGRERRYAAEIPGLPDVARFTSRAQALAFHDQVLAAVRHFIASQERSG